MAIDRRRRHLTIGISIDVVKVVRYLFAHDEKGFAAHTLIASDAVFWTATDPLCVLNGAFAMAVPSTTEILVSASAREKAGSTRFHPIGTIRCVGEPAFRNHLARDLGCLLDVDLDVEEWICQPLVLRNGSRSHVPDFLVTGGDERCLISAIEADPESWIVEAALEHGFRFRRKTAREIRAGSRLENACDLLRYARWHCPLGDRVRLLAALDEHGSMTFADCLPAFMEVRPIAGLSSLILHRFIEVDLDEGRIGPETQVRRTRGQSS